MDVSPPIRYVEAVYRDAVLSEYRGNPLIEALDPIASEVQWMKRLVRRPLFDEAERLLPSHIRLHCLPRLMRFFFPLRQHIDLAERLDLMLRQGYVHRNPLTPERAVLLQKTYLLQREGAFAAEPSEVNVLLTSSLCGISGAGKSTTAEAILAHYPQLIVHPQHSLYQVVWIKVSCPSDGSLKALCTSILGEFDRLLGTRFKPKPGHRMGVEDLLAEVGRVAATYSLGLLVIDEIQNLSVKRSGGRDAMLNFFQNLANDLKLPVFLIGTMKAIALLEESFRVARRAAAVGSFEWALMPLDKSWEALVKVMWKYQWVQHPVQFSEETAKELHHLSAGVLALAVGVFVMAQLHAIRGKTETVNLEALRRVAETEFKPLRPLLDALRSGDMRRIAQYDDMMSSDFWERLHKIVDSFKAPVVPGPEQPKSGDGWAKAIVALVTMGFPERDAEQALLQAKAEGLDTISAMVRRSLEILQAGSLMPQSDDPGDLRR